MDESIYYDQSKKTNWFPIIAIFLIIFIVILISIILIFSFKKPLKISNEELSIGKSLVLRVGQTAKFSINNEEHELKVDSVTSNLVTVIIQSNKITITLQVGEDKEIDLDKDGKKDIKIKLEKIENNKPIIKIIKTEDQIEDNQIEEDLPKCNEDWECNTWTSCINNEKVRSCIDDNNCGTKEGKPNEWELCGEIEDGTHVVINEKLFYKKTEVHNEINCGNHGLAQGQCNLTIHYYRGIYGEDAEKHFDANGLYVFVASYNNTSQENFLNSLQTLYGNSPQTGSFNNNNYYKNAEGTPEQRAAEPGGADEGIYWISEDKYILLHHNGIDGDTPNGKKSNMYFNALLEIYTNEYPSDLVI